jgi:hypothetical protein
MLEALVQGLPNVAASLALVNGNDKRLATRVIIPKVPAGFFIHDGGLAGKFCA